MSGNQIDIVEFVGVCVSPSGNVHLALGASRDTDKYLNTVDNPVKTGEFIDEWDGEAMGMDNRPIPSVSLTVKDVERLIEVLQNCIEEIN